MAAAADRSRLLDRQSEAIANRVLRLWGRVDRNDIRGSWAALTPDAYALVSLGQLAAATGADASMDAAWAESTGTTTEAEGRVVARSLVGVASDGRSLATLLQQPAIKALTLIEQGASTAQALASGGQSLALITATQVVDAGRAADTVALTARPKIEGYVRQLNTPSCSRCAVLAGKWFRWNEGFRRHPRCDCVHVPSSRADAATVDPVAYFNSLPLAQQDRYFGKADAAAIRNGGDLIGLVNARQRGQVVSVTTAAPRIPAERLRDGARTAERLASVRQQLTVLRGQADAGTATDWTRNRIATLNDELASLLADPKVMPEQLIAAADSRTQAIADLTRFGYVA